MLHKSSGVKQNSYFSSIRIAFIAKSMVNLNIFHTHNKVHSKKSYLHKRIVKVEIFLKGSLDSIPSPSPSVKIQIMGGKVCLRFLGKSLLGVVNKLFVFKSLLTRPGNVLPLHLKQTFPSIIWIFTEGEGDEIKSKLSS